MIKATIILWILVFVLSALLRLFAATMDNEEKLIYALKGHVPKRIQVVNLIRFPLILITIIVTIIAIIQF